MNRPSNSRLFRTFAVTLVLAMLAVTASFTRTQPASALSAFDTELFNLINNHRLSLGLSGLTESVSLDNGSMALSQRNRNRNLPRSSCGGGGWVQDHEPGVQGEVIGFSCGPIGVPISLPPGPGEYTYPNMPQLCSARHPAPSPEAIFCGWVDSASHRAILELPGLRGAGVGTSSVDFPGENSRAVFSTARFQFEVPTDPPPPPNDPNLCDGLEPTVNLQTGAGSPTNGRDIILGTNGRDIINGLGGNDVICGLSGIDYIFGGHGNDTIFGGGGSDRIYGMSGDDSISAGSGADRVWGGVGDDVILGQGGQDRLWGEDGNDDIQGNWESDRIWGGNGNDTLRGARGKDKIYGGAGNDAMFGGHNTDYLDGGTGRDTADGQLGKDNPVVANVSGCTNVVSRISC